MGTAGRKPDVAPPAQSLQNREPISFVARAQANLARVVGDAAVLDSGEPPPGFSEDFGLFQAEAPGVFFFLGAGNAAKGVTAMPHTPTFALDESAIAFGIRAMAAVVIGAG